jgi:glutamate/tyrosine decarboxylase-like PLP-dependent enzyme
MTDFEVDPADILSRLRELRSADAPTHGGHVLSYVYDSGLAELDELAAEAIRIVQPVNGLDPTTFTSVAVMEREVIGFARQLLHGDDDVVGSVTTGGTESCLLAVKTARDNWRLRGGVGQPRLLAPITVHAAFQKAAHYFGLVLDLVPVDPATGAVAASALISRLGADVALVVVSAPSYPFAGLDPVAEVAAVALAAGVDCHVDACIGGLVLPFWEGLPPWDFSVAGVTSISADLHKFGYSPKGASVLLQRGRDRQRTQYFATTRWPGYPVVNPTILGSKSAGALAASWAIIQALGMPGFKRLADSCARSTAALISAISGIAGLRVVGSPVGPLIAVTTDDSVPAEQRVDPHHWADQVREHGWLLQLQPAVDGLPRTTHLTITPVTEGVLPALTTALIAAADEVRGVPGVTAADVLGALPPLSGPLDSESAFALLSGLGLGAGGGLPDRMAPLLAIMEALPAPVAERLLTELLARLVEPR